MTIISKLHSRDPITYLLSKIILNNYSRDGNTRSHY